MSVFLEILYSNCCYYNNALTEHYNTNTNKKTNSIIKFFEYITDFVLVGKVGCCKTGNGNPVLKVLVPTF